MTPFARPPRGNPTRRAGTNPHREQEQPHMSRHSIVESYDETPRDEPIEERLRLRATWALTMSDDVRTIERVEWTSATIEHRDWEGTKLGELTLSAELVRALQPLIVKLLADAERLELAVERDEPTHDEIEQPDASTGEVFTIAEQPIVPSAHEIER